MCLRDIRLAVYGSGRSGGGGGHGGQLILTLKEAEYTMRAQVAPYGPPLLVDLITSNTNST